MSLLHADLLWLYRLSSGPASLALVASAISMSRPLYPSQPTLVSRAQLWCPVHNSGVPLCSIHSGVPCQRNPTPLSSIGCAKINQGVRSEIKFGNFHKRHHPPPLTLYLYNELNAEICVRCPFIVCMNVAFWKTLPSSVKASFTFSFGQGSRDACSSGTF